MYRVRSAQPGEFAQDAAQGLVEDLANVEKLDVTVDRPTAGFNNTAIGLVAAEADDTRCPWKQQTELDQRGIVCCLGHRLSALRFPSPGDSVVTH